MFDSLIESGLQRAFAPLVKTGHLDVVTPSGKTLTFGDGGQPQARIRFADRRAVFILLRDPDLNFGEMFMQERLVVDKGSVYDVLELVLRHAKSVPDSKAVQLIDAFRMKLRPILQNNLRSKSRANVAHHYDLDDRLYQLFLDEDRQYSCAYFEQGDEDLKPRNWPRSAISPPSCWWSPVSVCSTSVAAGAAWRGILPRSARPGM